MFEPGHARLTAIEWLLQHLAVTKCLEGDDPMGQVMAMKRSAEDYSKALTDAFKHVQLEQRQVSLQTLVDINVALDQLVDPILENVAAAVERTDD